MNQAQKLYLLGSGWLSTQGFGTFAQLPRFSKEQGAYQYPKLEDYLSELPGRFGRFDVYTKVCFATAVLAINDGGILQREGKKNIGVVLGSASGVYDNDLDFFRSTGEAQGEFSSPNLFTYTLPIVALGEIAVYYNFIGPTFCVGNDPEHPGREALGAALALLETGQCHSVLTGWVEVANKLENNENVSKGAAFALLTKHQTGKAKGEWQFDQNYEFSSLYSRQ